MLGQFKSSVLVSGCFFSMFLSFFRGNTVTTIKWPFYLFVTLAFTPKASKNGKGFFSCCKSKSSVLLVAKRSAMVFFFVEMSFVDF